LACGVLCYVCVCVCSPAAVLLVGRLGRLGLCSAISVWRRRPCSPMRLPHCSKRLPSAGDVRCLEEARALMAATGADGVMSAEPLLMNPMLFDAVQQPHDVSGVCQGGAGGGDPGGGGMQECSAGVRSRGRAYGRGGWCGLGGPERNWQCGLIEKHVDGVISTEPLMMNSMMFDAMQQPHDVSGMDQGWRVWVEGLTTSTGRVWVARQHFAGWN
jgi:hypothetical protein